VELFMTAAAGMPAEFLGDMREGDFWTGLEAVAHTIAYDGRNVGDTMSGRPLRTDLWNGVDVPVLVLHGDSTRPYLAAGARAVAEHLPTATLQVVPGENHSTTPEVLAPVLRAFAGKES
jgi:pimeloyl-ACP methyl ester carboxylesterase